MSAHFEFDQAKTHIELRVAVDGQKYDFAAEIAHTDNPLTGGSYELQFPVSPPDESTHISLTDRRLLFETSSASYALALGYALRRTAEMMIHELESRPSKDRE